ncbi:ricin-type beta-trefoil lectin domain protein (plasmid) [Streptomyces sp. AHU1]|uniref:ricin-type beta-trefoil lectin domain protein n=1 Tax=Streptomyces sp. AHU1 TaxID=3377215 RepID=UPI0038782CF2
MTVLGGGALDPAVGGFASETPGSSPSAHASTKEGHHATSTQAVKKSPTAKASSSARPSSHTSTAKSGVHVVTDKTKTTPALPVYALYSSVSGRCIDVMGGTSNGGTPLQIWDCNGTPAQQWQFASDGTIRAQGKCMEVAGGSSIDGTPIELAGCNGTHAQQFRLNTAHDLTNGSMCVDITDSATASGTRLQLWQCNGHSNQKWWRS